MVYTEGSIVFDGWKIEKLIGEGSYGKVYEIAKTEYGITTISALKVISIPQSQTEVKNAYNDGMDEQSVTTYFKGFVDEIVKEILIMSKVKSHSNVVSYEDHKIVEHESEIGWDILIRMEYLTPFVDYQYNHKLTEEEIVRLGIEISDALDFCHRKGLVHRDVKPDNIFVSETGVFKIGDFGVAKTIEKTSGGMSKKGTEVYMAPEVYIGKPYGTSVDTYSLGLVMYRLLNSNRLPFLPLPPTPLTFENKENALIRRMQGEVLVAPVNASERIAEIVLKACAYAPENRYQNAGELARALKAAIAFIPENNVACATESIVEENVESSDTSVLEREMTVGIWDTNEKLNAEEKIDGVVVEKNVEPKIEIQEEKLEMPGTNTKEPKKKSYLGFILTGVGVVVAIVVVIICIVNSSKDKTETNNVQNESTSAQNESESRFEVEKIASRIDTLVDSIESFTEVSINEQVLVDREGLKITATGINPNGDKGVELQVRIENNTDRNLTIQSRKESINGFMVSGVMSEDVQSGGIAETHIKFSKRALKEIGIKTIANIELSFISFEKDSKELSRNRVEYEMSSIYTSAARGFKQPIYDSGLELCEKDGVDVIYRGLSYNHECHTSGPCMCFLVENNTDGILSYRDFDIMINGKKMGCTPNNIMCVITPGKKAIVDVGLYSQDFEDNEITVMDKAEVSFTVYKDDNSLFELDSVELDIQADAKLVDEIIDNASEEAVEDIQDAENTNTDSGIYIIDDDEIVYILNEKEVAETQKLIDAFEGIISDYTSIYSGLKNRRAMIEAIAEEEPRLEFSENDENHKWALEYKGESTVDVYKGEAGTNVSKWCFEYIKADSDKKNIINNVVHMKVGIGDEIDDFYSKYNIDKSALELFSDGEFVRVGKHEYYFYIRDGHININKDKYGDGTWGLGSITLSSLVGKTKIDSIEVEFN